MSYQQHILLSEYSNACAPVYQSESCCNRSKRWCCSCLCPTCMTARNLYLLGHRFWFLAIILAWLPCFASYYRGFIYKELKVPSQGGLANCLLHSCCFCKTCTIVQETRSSIVHSNNGRPRLSSVESVLIAQQSYENQKQHQEQKSSSQTQQSKQYHTTETQHVYDIETGSISNSNPQYFNNVDNHHTTPLIYEDGQIFIQNIPPQHPTKGNNYRRSSMQYHDGANDDHHVQELSPTHKQHQYHQHYQQQHQHQQYQGMNGYPQFHGRYHINLNAPLVMDRPMPPQSAPVIRSITTFTNLQQQNGFNSKGNKVTDKSTLFGPNSTQSYPSYNSLHDCPTEQSFTQSTQQHQHNSQHHEVILATEPRGMPHYVPMYQPYKIATSEENGHNQQNQQHQQQNDLLQHYYPARCPGRHLSIHPERGVVTPQQSETMITFPIHQFTSPQMVIEEGDDNLYQTPETNCRQLDAIEVSNNNNGQQPNENQQLTNKPSILKLTPFQKKHMYSSDIRHQMEQLAQPTLQDQHDEQEQFHSSTESVVPQQQPQQQPPQHQQQSQQRSITIIPCDEDDEKNTINPLTGEDHIVSLSRTPSILSNSRQSMSCIANRSNCSKLSTNNSYITTCSTNQSSNSTSNNNKNEKVFFQTTLPNDLIEDSNGTEPKLLTECKPISFVDTDIDPHYDPTARLSFASAYLPTSSLEYSTDASIDRYSGKLDQIDSSSIISNTKHQNNNNNNHAIIGRHNKQGISNMNQHDISTQQPQQKSHHHTRSYTADSNYNVNSTRVSKLYVDTSQNNHKCSKFDEIHINSPISPIDDDIEEDDQRISIAFDQLHNQINPNDFTDDQQLMYHIMTRGLHDKPKRTNKKNNTTKDDENNITAISTTNNEPISSNRNQQEDKVVEHDDLYEDDGYYVDYYNSDATSTSLFSHHRSTPNSTVVKSLERSTSNVKPFHPGILSPSQYQLQIDRQATSIDNTNIPNSSKLSQRKFQQQQQQSNSYTPLQTDYFSSRGNDTIIPDIFELNQFNSAVQHFLEQQFENNDNGDNLKEQNNQSGLLTPVSRSRNQNGTNNQVFQFEDGFGSLYTPQQYQQHHQLQPTRTFCLSQYQQDNSTSNNNSIQSTTIPTLLSTPTITPNANVQDQVDLLSSSESLQPSISGPLTSIQEIDSCGDENHLSNIPPRDDTQTPTDTNDINNAIVIKSPPPSIEILTTKLPQPNMKLNISTVSLSPYCFPVRASNTRPSARQTESTPIEYHITSSDDDLPVVSSTMSTTQDTSTNDYNTTPPIQPSTTAIEPTNKQQQQLTIVSTDEIAIRRIISIESETEQNEPTIIEKYASDKDFV